MCFFNLAPVTFIHFNTESQLRVFYACLESTGVHRCLFNRYRVGLCLCSQRRKFLRMKREKYGYIYRTHLFGNPTVRVTGAENVRQILLGEHKLVSVQWPASVRTILGSDTLSSVHGAQHKAKKKVKEFYLELFCVARVVT